MSNILLIRNDSFNEEVLCIFQPLVEKHIQLLKPMICCFLRFMLGELSIVEKKQ